MRTSVVCTPPPITSCLRGLPAWGQWERADLRNPDVLSSSAQQQLVSSFLTGPRHVCGVHLCAVGATRSFVAGAQSGHGRGWRWEVPCWWASWEKEVLIPLSIHHVICKTRIRARVVKVLNTICTTAHFYHFTVLLMGSTWKPAPLRLPGSTWLPPLCDAVCPLKSIWVLNRTTWFTLWLNYTQADPIY